VVQNSARRVALAALKAWRKKKEFADTIISRSLSEIALQSADRAFAVELFYGVLRNTTLLDFWIGALRRPRIDTDLRDLLRLGLYQLFIAKTPEHAAVYETVELAPKRQRSVVNGILRSAARRKCELQMKEKSQAPDVRFSQPEFLIERWKRQFGEKQTKALCEWNNRPPMIYARINHLKMDHQTFLDRYREARSLPSITNFVELPSPTGALAQGDCYVQDPSTVIACELLQPKSGEKILDACAAPGGKTSYLAELMKNEGSLIAVDREPDRLRLLENNLDRLGVEIAEVVCHDWT
jgi:16S rRNA (cytosine967-C5)-methyltransferase